MEDKIIISPAQKIHGTMTPPGDKSISHRALMLGALAEGDTVIKGLLKGEDCLCTWAALKDLGVDIKERGDEIIVHGAGLWGLREPADVLNMGNSGTSTRLLAGILAAQPFFSALTGDSSLRRRPMKRVIDPLRQMGAQIWGRKSDNLAPLAIQGRKLNPIQYPLKQASAQVKSAILLAGLFVEGVSEISEPALSRDHTERMLKAMGADLKIDGLKVSLKGQPRLKGINITVPGDISAAAFFIAAALIVPGSELVIKNVGLNPTRTGLLDVLMKMGANIEIINQTTSGDEPVGDLLVKYSRLKGTTVAGDVVPRMIDEFPIFAVLSALAVGQTTIREAAELRVKESDRISTLAGELRKAGVKIEEFNDGMKIEGNTKIKGANFESHGDHRLAMSAAILALAAEGSSQINNLSCVQTSFPGFFEELKKLSQ